MTADEALKWAQVYTSLLALGVPIAKLVVLFKGLLSTEDYARVLATIKAGWQAASDENLRRIKDLDAQTG